MSPLARLQLVYAAPDNADDAAVLRAVNATLDGLASPAVELAMANLVASYVERHDGPDLERAERYVLEAWQEQLAAP